MVRFASQCLLVLLFFASFSFTQVDPNIEQGMKPYGSFEGTNIESVSVTNGNLTIHQPLWSAAQRGSMGLDLGLIYNNKSFSVLKSPSNCGGPHSPCTYTVVWHGTGVTMAASEGFGTGCQSVPSTQADQNGNILSFNDCTVSMADGAQHIVADTGNGYSQAIDGSGFRYYPGTLTTVDSTGKVNVSSTLVLTDSNGNQLNGRADNNGSSLVDTLGRSLPQTVSTGNISSCPALGYSFQSVSSASSWNFAGPAGTSALLLCFTTIHVHTAFFGGDSLHFHDASANTSMLQSIVLPNGSYWAFQYDAADPNNTSSFGYGDLLKITLPSGGSISYTWASVGACIVSPSLIPSRAVITRTIDDGNGLKTWTYTWNTSMVTGGGQYSVKNIVTDPLGNDTVHSITGLGGSCSLYETQTDSYQGSSSSGTLLKTVTTDYSYTSNPYDMSGTSPANTVAGVVPIRVTTILPGGLTSKIETDYDSGFVYRDPLYGNAFVSPPQSNTYTVTYGRPVARREYDWGQGAPGALVRQTLTSYMFQVNGAYLTANMLDLPSFVKVQDAAGHLCSETDYTYDEGTPTPANITTQHGSAPAAVRGNLTTVTRKLSSAPCAANATWTLVPSHTSFFDTGEVQSSTDPGGHTSTHTYDAFYKGAYSTQSCAPSTYGGSITHCVSGTYDFNTGLLTSFTNENATTQASGNTQGDTNHTKVFSYDTSLRMTQALFPPDPDPNNGPNPELVTFIYPNPATIPDTVTRTKKTTPSLTDTATTYFDRLGRAYQTDHATPGGTAEALTTYDALGRAATVTNPYYVGTNHQTDPTYGVTQTQFDALSRPTQVIRQDGSISTVAYSANCTTTTDEAGTKRKSCSDALGRLTGVWEDPTGLNYETDYQYDPLGNLIRVDQKGSAPTDSTQWRTRLFTYDSFSRLLTAANPESGTITYSYDLDGNLLQKTSPAPNQIGTATQTVSYCYDELHRATGRAYSAQTCQGTQLPAGTAVVSYTYDQALNAKGKLISMTDQAGNVTYSYDRLGRMATETRSLTLVNTPTVSKSLSYEYNLDGSLKTLHYPSGAAVNYTPDSAGRITQAVDSGSNINYATSASYGADGSLTGFVSGSGGAAAMTNTFTYNNRLQPVTMSAVSPSQTVYSIGYDFHKGSGNNGNVWGITNNKDSNRSQTFTYDALNRLTSAQNTGTDCTAKVLQNKNEYWGNSYGYDAWGSLTNKTETKCGAEHLSVTTDAHNWIHAAGTDYQYDAAGNMIFNATPPTQTYTYDQENRITGAAGYGYVYDGDGNRVEKVTPASPATPTSATLYWYMTPGVVAETDLSGTIKSEYIFFDGERVARRDGVNGAGGVFYYFSDHLKTASIITNSAGVIMADSDYYPWGGELQFIANDSNDYKFTGKKRDAETGLDYFGARYYSNGLGRWVSADWSPTPIPVPYADFVDPQTLNQYTYVRNLPTTKADMDGHCAGDGCKDMTVAVTVETKPSFNANVPQKNGTYKTGTTGRLAIEVKYKGGPVNKLPLHEDVTSKTTRNGAPATNVNEVIPSDAKTNEGGKVGDKIGLELTTKTPASPDLAGGVKEDQSSNGYVLQQTQTVTFPGPNGETCTTTYDRTFSNVDKNGNMNQTDPNTGSNYKLSTSTEHPSVKEKKEK